MESFMKYFKLLDMVDDSVNLFIFNEFKRMTMHYYATDIQFISVAANSIRGYHGYAYWNTWNAIVN